uniref:Uncharacterized protein n=1 Tax=viral metagenome TaxID=1070528 RepID=A0A6C0F941_9ZZZZ|tara:strand:- start:809 stop:1078 length:270 start_codon:yes stop_codon:yes gene_type:complete
MWQNGFFFITGFIFGRYYNNKSPPSSPIIDICSPPPSPVEIKTPILPLPEPHAELTTYKELRAYAKFLGIPEFHKMKFDDLKYAVSKYI